MATCVEGTAAWNPDLWDLGGSAKQVYVVDVHNNYVQGQRSLRQFVRSCLSVDDIGKRVVRVVPREITTSDGSLFYDWTYVPGEKLTEHDIFVVETTGKEGLQLKSLDKILIIQGNECKKFNDGGWAALSERLKKNFIVEL